MNQNKTFPTTFIKMFECHMPYLLQTLSEVMKVAPGYA
jgi:hypothetical protein